MAAQQTYELSPSREVRVEDATPHHWIGTCESLAILVLRDGSQDDPRHMREIDRVIAQLATKASAPLFLMVVFAPTLTKPPSAAVREAIAAAGPTLTKLSRGAAVVMGQGFLAAIHRGAMTGILSMLRLPAAVRVVATVPEAIEHIFGRDAASWVGLVRLCEERAASKD
ncbi:MAG: hypothetical protein JNK05_31280 [Myxococcales bacterium]|nr:hypothetical protein [Myxococcales bacterium]